ncbi:hypothetical protein F5B17DRAFT_382964 [Nemania serpens]|nr:hypothetical protein F5B17DRAFT_382964 [Nemania serpens]
MTVRPLIPSGSRAALSGTRLTHTPYIHPNLLRISSLSIDISRDISAWTTKQPDINLRKNLATGLARFLSSSTTSTPVKKDDTAGASKNKSPSQSGRGEHRTSSPSEDHYTINFRDLGMNRITKFVVYTVISVLGTMETIFWCKVLWRWWTGEQEDSE